MGGRGDFSKKSSALHKCSNNFGKDCPKATFSICYQMLHSKQLLRYFKGKLYESLINFSVFEENMSKDKGTCILHGCS